MLRERVVTLLDARRLAAPLLGDVVWQPDVDFPPPGVSVDLALALLDDCIAAVEEGMQEDPTALRERLTRLVEAAGAKPRIVFRVLFIAILGSPVGLPVFDAMAFLGAEKTLLRLRAARKLLENLPPPSS
jgi:glutamyl-tRNA synthetase